MTRTAIIVLACLVALACGGCDPHAEDKEEIRAVYADYNDFNERGNGPAILAVFTESSFPVYEKLIKVALDGKPEDLKKLSPLSRLEVFRMRCRAKRAEIEKLNGKQYTEYATTRRWYVTPPSLRTEDTLGAITVKGDLATAELISDGDRTGVRLRFLKEGGTWRFDEPHAMQQWDRMTEREARFAGVSVDELLIAHLEEELGREVDEKVLWRPMAK